MKKGLVSVVMSAYNAENFIGDSIGSILNQSYTNWELLLINDFSSDKTIQIMEAYCENCSRIKVINNKKNEGLTKSLNVGIEHAKGEFIARLDSDDIAETARFEKQVNYLNLHPEIDLVGSGAYLIDNSGCEKGRIEVLSKEKHIKKVVKYVNPFIHSSIMIRKKTINQLGNYRDKFQYSQDYDLVLRCNDEYNIANISEPLIKWRVSENSLTMQHHILQRTYADIAREFAVEREEKEVDSYNSIDFNKEIQRMIAKNKGRYYCEYGIYQIIFMKQYKSGLIEMLKGIKRGAIPYNTFMRGFIQMFVKLNNLNKS